MQREPSPSMRRKGMVPLRKKKSHEGLVLKKLGKLKRIVPGSKNVGLEVLLQRTANYIYFLELQVIVLRSMSDL
ncbi:unnamed protein product [Musa acuminata var. zebrina]